MNHEKAEVWIVLGMHKSGTTLIARLLHESGIIFGAFDSGLPYNICKYEDHVIKHINERFITGRTPWSADLYLVDKISPEAVKRSTDELLQWIGASRTIGIKDPRCVLTYRVFWKHALPAHRIIVVWRPFTSVLLHYIRNNRRKVLSSPLAFIRQVSNAWIQSNTELAKIINETEKTDRLILNTDEIRKTPRAIKRLEHFTNKTLNRRIIKTLPAVSLPLKITTIAATFALSRGALNQARSLEKFMERKGRC